MFENIWSGCLFLKLFCCDAKGVSQRTQVCGGDPVHFFLSLHVGRRKLGHSASEFVFVVTGHLVLFTTSIHESMEFHPPAARL